MWLMANWSHASRFFSRFNLKTTVGIERPFAEIGCVCLGPRSGERGYVGRVIAGSLPQQDVRRLLFGFRRWSQGIVVFLFLLGGEFY